MEKRKNLYLKLTVYFLIFLVFVFLSIYFLLQARDSHREFKNIEKVQVIEESMTIGFIVNKFGISEQDIYSELKLPASHWNQRYTVAQVCQKNKLDCRVVVDNLNKKISR